MKFVIQPCQEEWTSSGEHARKDRLFASLFFLTEVKTDADKLSDDEVGSICVHIMPRAGC